MDKVKSSYLLCFFGMLLLGFLSTTSAYAKNIHAAAAAGNIKTIKKFLNNGGDVNVIPPPVWISRATSGKTLLHFAIGGGQLETAAYLIDRGADIERTSQVGRPLYYAANLANADMVELLLRRGANIHASDNAGYTARNFIPYTQSRNRAGSD